MSIDYKNEGNVSINVDSGVSYIEFSHPQSNSLPSAILKRLAKAIDDESRNSYNLIFAKV